MKVRVAFLAATFVELGIWVGWLVVAIEVNQVVGAVVLLVLMHLKHQIEISTLRDTSYFKNFFGGTIASAAEAAGAVACLALIIDDRPELAAAALAAGFVVEHALLMTELRSAIAERDVSVPRLRPPPPTTRGPDRRGRG